MILVFKELKVILEPQGQIIINNITNDIGLLLDETSEFFNSLPEPHVSRLMDVNTGDGWI